MGHRSRVSLFSIGLTIESETIYFALNPWAVKLHAYTLDSSANLASAVQQNKLLHRSPEAVLFFSKGW